MHDIIVRVCISIRVMSIYVNNYYLVNIIRLIINKIEINIIKKR